MLREFSTTKPALQQILMGLLEVEKENPRTESRKLLMEKLTGKSKYKVR